MVAFTYDPDTSKPLFYVASGQVTQAQPYSSQLADPPFPYEHEYPYQFVGTYYRFDAGPCLTCFIPGWNTAEHAVEAGDIRLRMPDLNRITLFLADADGMHYINELRRQGFGRPGYDLGRDDHWLLPDLRGEWVFVDRSAPDAPVWHFNFTEVKAPQPVSDPEQTFYQRHVPSIMSFVDPVADATLSCTRFGCGLVQDDKTLFLVKFLDIGMDHLLGYKGDELFSDNGESFRYRTGDLVVGMHVIDPVPDAAPPEE